MTVELIIWRFCFTSVPTSRAIPQCMCWCLLVVHGHCKISTKWSVAWLSMHKLVVLRTVLRLRRDIFNESWTMRSHRNKADFCETTCVVWCECKRGDDCFHRYVCLWSSSGPYPIVQLWVGRLSLMIRSTRFLLELNRQCSSHLLLKFSCTFLVPRLSLSSTHANNPYFPQSRHDLDRCSHRNCDFPFSCAARSLSLPVN